LPSSGKLLHLGGAVTGEIFQFCSIFSKIEQLPAIGITRNQLPSGLADGLITFVFPVNRFMEFAPQ
jgi:hypothetical protein